MTGSYLHFKAFNLNFRKPQRICLLSAFAIFLFYSNLSNGQNSSIGLEFQVYPTGLIPGIRYEIAFSEKDHLLFRFGYNWFRHRDLGVHSDEKGDGLGFTLGYKYSLKPADNNWSLAFKNDFWWNSVEWYDMAGNDLLIRGQSSIFVLQPSIELSHNWNLGSGLKIAPSISFGFEWNLHTRGEPTGEGAIILLGIQLMKALDL